MGLRDWIAGLLGGKKGDDGLASLVDQLRRRREELERASVRLGFIGGTGSGKSSLINALLGRAVAQEGVGPTSHPVAGEESEAEGRLPVARPGSGAVGRPLKTYIQALNPLDPGRYDGFVLVTASRLTEGDRDLFEELHAKGGKPFFVVRSHFDLAVRTAGG